ncbi:hypothetical protein LguiA_000458 [Lonicera macranthoides]
MSNTGLVLSAEGEKIYKKSFHQRHNSGELDVFEAARYFSGANEVSNASNFAQKIMRDQRSGGRISLDMPMGRNSIPSHNTHVIEKPMTKEKKYKQPSSPGGRLASFLNSIFNQTSSKKKKSKSTTQSMKDEDESPGGRRKRRSSISHFPSVNTGYSSSFYSNSSSSGFRTPPPYSQTPSKSYKDIRSYSDHKTQLITLSKQSNKQGNANVNVKSSVLPNEEFEEKFKFCNGFPEKHKNLSNGFSEKVRIREILNPSEEREFKKFNTESDDDGAESDSSSDLFELQNYDLGCYSSGLPVYETTHVDSIKRGAPISNGAV